MKPTSFLWAYQISGDALGEGEGISRSQEAALQDMTAHIRKDFPRSPQPRFLLMQQRPDQDLYYLYGETEYSGMASVSPITQQELMQLNVALSPAAEANPRARNNWAFLVPIATRLATAIVTGLGAATWSKLASMSIPDRAAWLEKNINRVMAVQSLGLSIGANKLMDKIPNVPALRKKAWLEIAMLMGDPSVQAAAKEAGKAVVAGTSSPKRNPGLPFKQAWKQAYASGQALKSPLGFVVRPIFDEEYGPWFADYETDRLVSGTTNGLWEVVPPPRRR